MNEISLKKKTKNLIIIGHPDTKSFCYNGIYPEIKKVLEEKNETVSVIDLYRDEFSREKKDLVNKYKELISLSDRIYFISPVWWFRCVPLMEMFFDEVMTPQFAFQFIPIYGVYGYPKPLLAKKKVRTFLTHGAPALPVLTIYLNSVKLRLVMGVYSFVFGWKLSHWFNTRQFFSVPFVTQEKRLKFLKIVKKDILRDIRKN